MSTLAQARQALDAVSALANQAIKTLAAQSSKDGKLAIGKMDEHQVVLYNLSYTMAEVAAARAGFEFAEKRGLNAAAPTLEEKLAYTFSAETVHNFSARYYAYPHAIGIDQQAVMAMHTPDMMAFQASWMDPKVYSAIAREVAEKGRGGEYGLGDEHQMFRETFKK